MAIDPGSPALLPRLRYLARKWAWAGLDLLYNPTCAGCGRSGSRWCPVCQASLRLEAAPHCPQCGDPADNPNRCARCEQHPLSLTAVRSLSAFDGPLRNAIHQLKYYQDQPLAQALGEALADYWRMLRWPRALVVPVPLSRERLAHRGYNQAELLADMLAGSAGLPVSSGALRRRRDTPSQVGLSASERWNNMIGAFEARPPLVRGQNILLIDDVFTTGATLQACAQALLLEGAGKVYGLTAARAGQTKWQDHSRSPE